jgi:hypothetical protein
VSLFVPSYGREAIWSYWGTEYIKLLVLLYRETQEEAYVRHARHNLTAYAQNILHYRGFPEVYAPDGSYLHSAFYKSIRKTGWVVDYEQALALYRSEAARTRAKGEQGFDPALWSSPARANTAPPEG